MTPYFSLYLHGHMSGSRHVRYLVRVSTVAMACSGYLKPGANALSNTLSPGTHQSQVPESGCKLFALNLDCVVNAHMYLSTCHTQQRRGFVLQRYGYSQHVSTSCGKSTVPTALRFLYGTPDRENLNEQYFHNGIYYSFTRTRPLFNTSYAAVNQRLAFSVRAD